MNFETLFGGQKPIIGMVHLRPLPGAPNYGGSMVLRDEPYGGQWGLIDTLGRETIPCRYYYLDTPGEGLAAFMLEQFGNYGYVDVKGNVAITPRFAVARPFRAVSPW